MDNKVKDNKEEAKEIKALNKADIEKQIADSQKAIQQIQGTMQQHIGVIALCNNMLESYKWEEVKPKS